jgi:hypothetical protein
LFSDFSFSLFFSFSFSSFFAFASSVQGNQDFISFDQLSGISFLPSQSDQEVTQDRKIVFQALFRKPGFSFFQSFSSSLS